MVKYSIIKHQNLQTLAILKLGIMWFRGIGLLSSKIVPVTPKIKNFQNLGVLEIQTGLSKNTQILLQPFTPELQQYWELGVLGNFIQEPNYIRPPSKIKIHKLQRWQFGTQTYQGLNDLFCTSNTSMVDQGQNKGCQNVLLYS